MKRLGAEAGAAAVADYVGGMTAPDVADKYGVTSAAIYYWLKKAGVKRRPSGPIRETPMDAEGPMVADYLAGTPSAAVAAKYGVGNSTVLRAVRRAGHEAREPTDAHRVYPLDETVFDTLTDASRYWLGFLLADSGLSANISGDQRNELQTCLSVVDRRHVEKLRDFFKTTKPLYERPSETRPAVSLSITSKRVVETLIRWGIEPRKSFTAKPHPELEGCRHFWRGVIDGDGSLTWDGRRHPIPVLRLVGSLATCEAFTQWAKGVTGTDRGVYRQVNIWCTVYTGRDAVRLVSEMYTGAAPECVLDRKAERAAKFMAWQPRQFDWSGVTGDMIAEKKARLKTWRAVAAEIGVSEAALYDARTLYQREWGLVGTVSDRRVRCRVS